MILTEFVPSNHKNKENEEKNMTSLDLSNKTDFINKINSEINDILSNERLSDEEKFILYSPLIQKLLFMTREIEKEKNALMTQLEKIINRQHVGDDRHLKFNSTAFDDRSFSTPETNKKTVKRNLDFEETAEKKIEPPLSDIKSEVKIHEKRPNSRRIFIGNNFEASVIPSETLSSTLQDTFGSTSLENSSMNDSFVSVISWDSMQFKTPQSLKKKSE